MKQSREDRVISKGESILKELEVLYEEGLGITEYAKLLAEYKKLKKRYEKVIKSGDKLSSQVMHKNENLEESLDYTIKSARAKLLYNVSEHRKTKENMQEYLKKIKFLELKLTKLNDEDEDSL